jgi:GxxExxY protein
MQMPQNTFYANNNIEDKVVYKELSYKINGLLFKTHTDLGYFRNEKQFADYFEILLQKEGIKYAREYRFEDNEYGKNKVRCVVDFIIEDKIILEFKAKDFITKEDYYQVKRYLVTLNLHLGILVNFRQHKLTPKRILNSLYYHNDNSH